MPLQIKNNTLLKVMHTKFTGRYALLHTICIGVRTLSTMQKLYGMVSQIMPLYNALITRYCYTIHTGGKDFVGLDIMSCDLLCKKSSCIELSWQRWCRNFPTNSNGDWIDTELVSNKFFLTFCVGLNIYWITYTHVNCKFSLYFMKPFLKII